MSTLLNFDARGVAPASVDGGAEQLPVSDVLGHRVIIIDDSVVNTKANDGSTMLVLKLQIIEGPNSGAKGDYRLNIGNKSEEARRIGYQQLSAICHALGVATVSNSQELYNKPFRAVVVAQDDNSQYTKIKGVLTDQGIDPGNPNAGPRKAPAAPAAATQAAPPAPQTFAAPPAAPAFGQPPAAAAPPAFSAAPPAAAPPATQWQPPAAASPATQWQPPAAAAGGTAQPPWGQR